MAYTIVIAGTTKNTAACAEALKADNRFSITGILTPEPKPIGRKQVVTKNPLHLFAEKNNLPTVTVEKQITADTLRLLKKENLGKERPDFLLVVDFGYLIPNELLEWSTIAPLNIHPSLLPKWRGSSPGQFSILYGDKKSGVTLMIMNESLDEGPILTQYPFTVEKDWTQNKYYNFSFKLISKHLADDIEQFAKGEITPEKQPETSPTPIARRLSKEDAFVTWETITMAMAGNNTKTLQSKLLEKAVAYHPNTAVLLTHAVRAFHPWPQLWTKIPTKKGPRRMKILQTRVKRDTLQLEKVHIAGQKPAKWNQVKNILVN